jgi:hypothetical protein
MDEEKIQTTRGGVGMRTATRTEIIHTFVPKNGRKVVVDGGFRHR